MVYGVLNVHAHLSGERTDCFERRHVEDLTHVPGRKNDFMSDKWFRVPSDNLVTRKPRHQTATRVIMS